MTKPLFIVNKNNQLFSIEQSLLNKLGIFQTLLNQGCIFFNNEQDACELVAKQPASLLSLDELVGASFVIFDENNDEYHQVFKNKISADQIFEIFINTNERPIAFTNYSDLIRFICQTDPASDFFPEEFNAFVVE